MGKSTVQAGKRASTVECGRFNCLDENDCCKHCGAHVADPHQPGVCPHADAPDDECDARLADAKPTGDEPVVTVKITSWSGGTVRFPGTPEGVEEYVRTRVAWRYRESTAKALLDWLADGAPSPYARPAWHGETEVWSWEATR